MGGGSRDSAARSAFRQMATAWAQLAFREDFTSSTADEQIRSTESVPAEKAASTAAAPTNENGVDDSNPAADVDASTADEQINRSSESIPKEKAASSATAPTNENGVGESNTETDFVGNYDRMHRADKTPELSWKQKRLSLLSRISFPKR